MANVIEVVLEDIADLIDRVGIVLGVTPASAVIKITGLVLHTAADVVHVIDAEELERIRKLRNIGTAAGQAAYEASNQDFHKLKKP